MSDFKREARYYVIKQKNLTEDQDAALCDLLSGAQIPCTDCVVVESHWPNYEHTWQTVQQVALGKFRDPYKETERLKAANGLKADLCMEWKVANNKAQARLAELATALQDAVDIIQADANTEENYGSLCRMGSALAKDSSAAWLLRQKADAVEAARDGICTFRGQLSNTADPDELTDFASKLRQAADEADKAGGGA